jgi:Lrp/AsnC family transcriptional regulator of ectoine degradation
MKLDRYDLAILRELQRNGRISKRELAEKIGLSVSPCWVRMRRLEDAGYIRGYRADIDFERIGRLCHVTTLIRLATHHIDDFKRFEQAVHELPQIVHCEAVIGESDYILRFVAADIDEYQKIMETLLDMDVGILNYFSHVRSKDIKDETSGMVRVLLDDVQPEP